ncbi:pr43.1 [rat cytomegalovirus strain Maastricht]|uniref:Pr43.1 n=1 Tax=Rat cytomegalovirus (strain Maastricht) TaxID=79700 RepID=Q9DWE7_RCMVM|nr:pr43.1 [rat cytomegalovirus strain Maastricht]AAF99142.1 pr43.1 [rat cytomegalovirus strain Maastricht]
MSSERPAALSTASLRDVRSSSLARTRDRGSPADIASVSRSCRVISRQAPRSPRAACSTSDPSVAVADVTVGERYVEVRPRGAWFYLTVRRGLTQSPRVSRGGVCE